MNDKLKTVNHPIITSVVQLSGLQWTVGKEVPGDDNKNTRIDRIFKVYDESGALKEIEVFASALDGNPYKGKGLAFHFTLMPLSCAIIGSAMREEVWTAMMEDAIDAEAEEFEEEDDEVPETPPQQQATAAPPNGSGQAVT